MTSRIRRIFLLVVVPLCLLLSPAAALAAKQNPPPIRGSSAIVVETTTGNIAYAKNPDERRQIASTTKLMTTLLALEHLKLDKKLPAANYKAETAETTIYLRPGELMSVADLIRATDIFSANDAAETLGQGVAGSKQAFVEMMNKRARELGLKNTHFANAAGMDHRNNYSTARDLVTLTLYLRKFPFFRETVKSARATIKSGDYVRRGPNSNFLIARHSWITGVKTGHTSKAGYVLVASGTPWDVDLISVIMGSPSEAARANDTVSLLRWGAKQFTRKKAVVKGATLASVPIRYRDEQKLKLTPAQDVKLTVPLGQKTSVRLVGVPADVDGPIKAGQPIAKADVYTGNRKMATVPLVADSAVAKASLGLRLKTWFFQPVPIILVVIGGLASFVLMRRSRLRRQRRFRRQQRRSQFDARHFETSH